LFAYVDDEKEHNQSIQLSNYFNMILRDTMKNWQYESSVSMADRGFIVSMATASLQSKSESDRVEEKIDPLIKKLDPENAQKVLKELEIKYPKKYTAKFHFFYMVIIKAVNHYNPPLLSSK
jgi:hypothetical protein